MRDIRGECTKVRSSVGIGASCVRVVHHVRAEGVMAGKKGATRKERCTVER